MKLSKDFKDVCKVFAAVSAGTATIAFTVVGSFFAPQDMGYFAIAGVITGAAMGSYIPTAGAEAFARFKRNGYQIKQRPSDMRLHSARPFD